MVPKKAYADDVERKTPFVSSSLYKRVVENEELHPFFDLEVNTGKAVVKAESDL